MKFLHTLSQVCRRVPEWLWLSVLYIVSHVISLTILPVFADEAIYIRWAQLIQDDMGRYAFFSMADGKPPLFMWVLSLVTRFTSDPLWAGRITAIAIGLLTVFVLRSLMRQFVDTKKATGIISALVCILPFWFFYHRMALMDGLLSLFLALTFLFAIRVSKNVFPQNRKNTLKDIIFLGLSFGGAMWTKTPALFIIPIVAITPIFFWLQQKHKPLSSLLRGVLYVFVGGLIGTGIFLVMRISPLFGALFTRSTDFTFTTKDLIAGEWHYVLFNSLLRNIGWIDWYMTPEIFILAFFGLFTKQRRTVLFLLLCGFLFFLPLTLFGRVLWPRYFLPTAIFLTLCATVSFLASMNHKWLRVASGVLLAFGLVRSTVFSGILLTNPEGFPFAPADRVQYLAEWSAGFGNKEVRDYIHERQSHLPQDGSKKIIVLTEGSFGTLPDGLLMYFHGGTRAKNLEIHGIGVAVHDIPSEYVRRAGSDEVYYMLNSNRVGIEDKSKLRLVFEVKRPSGPSLLFFQVLPKK